MKKIALALCFVVASSFVFAEGFKLSGGVGFSYMNHYAISKYSVGSAFKGILESELNGLTAGSAVVENATAKKMYNSMMVGLDLKFGMDLTYNEFGGYLSANVGIPYKISFLTPSPMDVVLKASALNKLNSSIIADTQLGFYINLFSQSPVQLYMGTGLAFNWLKHKRDLPVASLSNLHKADGSNIDVSSIDSISEQVTTRMLGIGINIGLTYYFSNSIGLFFSINDSCYFYDMGSDCSLVGKLANGHDFTYKIAKDGKLASEDVASFGKNTFANNFGVKAGFSFRI